MANARSTLPLRIHRYTAGTRTRPPTALAIGNFDGVHQGHRQLIRTVLERADHEQIEHLVCTFEPPPDQFFAKTALRLHNLRTKMCLLAALGVRQIMLIPFRSPFRELAPAEFIGSFLQRDMNARYVVTGKDFRFGNQRRGDQHYLAQVAAQRGFVYQVMADFPDARRRISSTKIRGLLSAGQMDAAAHALGASYGIAARIKAGAGLGRKLFNTPTANLALNNFIPPLRGVFACRATLPNGEHKHAVANCGVKPSLGGTQFGIEIHLLNCDMNLYHQVVYVEFLARLRPEKKFSNIAALRKQIAADKRTALALLSRKFAR